MNDKNPTIEIDIKIIDSIIFRHKVMVALLGLMTLNIFLLYYYVLNANALAYAISGSVYIWILYTNYLRISELRLLKMEVNIFVEEYKRRLEKEEKKK